MYHSVSRELLRVYECIVLHVVLRRVVRLQLQQSVPLQLRYGRM